ncbi:MAG TPA: hypothetical protein VK815_02200 [Candidatus Acidoferrales bacterium]|jgi:hypothetical protein|nr:hypothetical protein [Candidatus Acidoferrales bacterium]
MGFCAGEVAAADSAARDIRLRQSFGATGSRAPDEWQNTSALPFLLISKLADFRANRHICDQSFLPEQQISPISMV